MERCAEIVLTEGSPADKRRCVQPKFTGGVATSTGAQLGIARAISLLPDLFLNVLLGTVRNTSPLILQASQCASL